MAIVLGTNSGFVIVVPSADPTGSDTTIDGSSVVTKHTSPVGSVKITEIGWYRGSGTNTANFEVALYSESAGVAATRLFVDNTNSSAAGGWIATTVDWAISESTAYWLAVQMDAHSGSSTIDSAASGGVGIDVLTSQTTLNDPYGGGAVSDADGIFAIYAKVSIARNVTAGLGALTLTGFAPVVTASDNKNLAAGLGALTLAGLAPVVAVTNNKNFLADVGSLTITGFAPVVSVTDNKNMNAGLGALTLTGFAPAVVLPLNINASLGDLIIAGFAPNVELPVNIQTLTGQITITGFEPSVVATDNKNLLADVGGLTVSGFAPQVELPVNLNASIGDLVITGFAPEVNTTSGITADTGQLILSGFTPTINITAGVTPPIGELLIDGFAPEVITPRNVSPGFGELIIEGFAPVIHIGGGEALIETETGLLFITGYAPTVVGGNKHIVPIGSGIDNSGGSSQVSDGGSHSTISRKRIKSKMENDI